MDLSSRLGVRRESTRRIPNASSVRSFKYFSAAISTDSLVDLDNFAYPNPGRSTRPNSGFCMEEDEEEEEEDGEEADVEEDPDVDVMQ